MHTDSPSSPDCVWREGRSVQNYILMLSSSAYKASQTWSISVITTVVSFSSSVIGRSSVSGCGWHYCFLFNVLYKLQLFVRLIYLKPKCAYVRGNLDAGEQGKEIHYKCSKFLEGNSYSHFKSGLHSKWPLSYRVWVWSTIPKLYNQHNFCWETITGLNI